MYWRVPAFSSVGKVSGGSLALLLAGCAAKVLLPPASPHPCPRTWDSESRPFSGYPPARPEGDPGVSHFQRGLALRASTALSRRLRDGSAQEETARRYHHASRGKKARSILQKNRFLVIKLMELITKAAREISPKSNQLEDSQDGHGDGNRVIAGL